MYLRICIMCSFRILFHVWWAQRRPIFSPNFSPISTCFYRPPREQRTSSRCKPVSSLPGLKLGPATKLAAQTQATGLPLTSSPSRIAHVPSPAAWLVSFCPMAFPFYFLAWPRCSKVCFRHNCFCQTRFSKGHAHPRVPHALFSFPMQRLAPMLLQAPILLMSARHAAPASPATPSQQQPLPYFGLFPFPRLFFSFS